MGSTDTIIAGLLVVSIVVSAVSLITPPQKLISLTGFATAPTGTTQLSVTEVVSISFLTSSINFGSVAVRSNVTSPASIYCDLYTSGTGTSNGTTNCVTIGLSNPAKLSLIDDGTENVTVDLKSSISGSSLLGGTNATFMWNVQANGTEGCVNMTSSTVAPGTTPVNSLQNVNTSSPGTRICQRLEALDANDTVDIGFYIGLPSDSIVSGSQTATITASATEIVD